jgi:hypothetical protein
MSARNRVRSFLIRVVLAAFCCTTARWDHAADLAADTATEGGELQTVTVVATGESTMAAASAGDITLEQLEAQPLLRPGAVLENVPGLIVTQHSGEGKANQYFMRAFNLDHGTDLSTQIDNMPVNLPSQAHGQGYTDLNFLIPELVSDLHYKKGPYYADEGDFAVAGAIRMDLLDAIAASATLGFGEDGYRRGLLLGSTAVGQGTLLGALEVYHNDGPFEHPDDYERINGVARYHRGTADSYFTLTAMTYHGSWNSTDQVPLPAIEGGLIGRFDSLNPSDGGTSSRSSVSFNLLRRSDAQQTELSAYVIRYQLDLWSTFTYYLKDPVNGDQMLQHDDRVVYGLKAAKTWYTTLWSKPSSNLVGVQARIDDIRDVGIDATVQRRYLYTEQDAGVLESNAAAYFENSTRWADKFRTVLGLREDEFDFDVRDRMRNADGSCNIHSDPLGCDTGNVRASIFSPKLGAIIGPWSGISYFVTVADGYHSNDARGVTRSGENPADGPVTPLTRATSAEIGLAAAPLPRWQTTLDVFALKLRSELVFDGDAGVTSPSGATTRTGTEWGNSVQLNSWLSADLNAAFSRGRFDHDVPPDDLGCSDAAPSHPCATPIAITGRYIPNSPSDVVSAALTAKHPAGWFGALRLRHFGESPLVEDDSARSPAYTTVDGQFGYRSSSGWQAEVNVFNLFNVAWNDIEYYYVYRLANQASPQAGYVVHPGVPRTIRVGLSVMLD